MYIVSVYVVCVCVCVKVEVKMRKCEGLQWAKLEGQDTPTDNPHPQMEAAAKGGPFTYVIISLANFSKYGLALQTPYSFYLHL